MLKYITIFISKTCVLILKLKGYQRLATGPTRSAMAASSKLNNNLQPNSTFPILARKTVSNFKNSHLSRDVIQGTNRVGIANSEARLPVTPFPRLKINITSEDELSSHIQFVFSFQFMSSACGFMSETEKEKIKHRVLNSYNQAQPVYLNSASFQNLLNVLIERLHDDPGNVFVHVLNLKDELKAHREKKSGANHVEIERKEEGNAVNSVSDNVDVNDVNERRIDKLELIMKKLENRIENLSKKELSLEKLNDINSAYVIQEKYVKKFNKAWEIYCKLTSRQAKTGRPLERPLKYSGTRYEELNQQIELFMKKKKNSFPDFCEIHELVKEANSKHNFNLSATAVHACALDIFEDIGKLLKDRRLQDLDQNSMYLCEPEEADPSNTDVELKNQLDSHIKIGQKNLEEVFRKYTDLQESKKLEPEEVCDYESEENNSSNDEETDNLPSGDEDLSETNVSSAENENLDGATNGKSVSDPSSPVVKMEVSEDNLSSVQSESSVSGSPTSVASNPDICIDMAQVSDEKKKSSSQEISLLASNSAKNTVDVSKICVTDVKSLKVEDDFKILNEQANSKTDESDIINIDEDNENENLANKVIQDWIKEGSSGSDQSSKNQDDLNISKKRSLPDSVEHNLNFVNTKKFKANEQKHVISAKKPIHPFAVNRNLNASKLSNNDSQSSSSRKFSPASTSHQAKVQKTASVSDFRFRNKIPKGLTISTVKQSTEIRTSLSKDLKVKRVNVRRTLSFSNSVKTKQDSPKVPKKSFKSGNKKCEEAEPEIITLDD
ncbi:Death domain-associated protein 6 [Nymphon striatum]|nr:Death domain-associated protein 6 [Nymphon striatum]